MPEPENPQLDRVERKINAVAASLGGPRLKDEFEKIEVGLPKRAQTFKRARCGCWRGNVHDRSCSKYRPGAAYHEQPTA